MVTFSSKLNQLGDAFRKVYNTSNKLSFDDMINLLCPPEKVLISKDMFTLTFMSRPLEVLSNGMYKSIQNSNSLPINQQLVLHLYLQTCSATSLEMQNSIPGTVVVKQGENVINFRPQNNIVLHPVNGSMTIDCSKSYIAEKM